MTTKNLIESLFLMFAIWSMRLAFLAAGAWMMYNGWFGCGITTVILTVFIGGKCDNNETAERKERNPDSAESCLNCKHYIPGNKEYYSCTKYGNFKFAKSTIIPCYMYDKKEKQNEP